ncbi:hypothetical protein OUZ56_032738 [Daphnia magna]|uniref:Uncharacterized protein n=1 Tax=Daphnia magna TaxID=35525 RepID=A0ABQ9ZWZ4_9CRUS|nr:hypothetical protein OUZ56_032738 [Daphnia magna]
MFTLRINSLRRPAIFQPPSDYGTVHQIGCLSPENERALAIIQEKTRRLEVGYEVPIIWLECDPDFVNNRQMAENRFRSLLNRFKRQPEFEKDYRTPVQKYFDQGYCKERPAANLFTTADFTPPMCDLGSHGEP